MANPVGMILSSALMIEDLGRGDLARQLQAAVDEVLDAGCATVDTARPGTAPLSTDEMGRRIAGAFADRLG